MKNWVNDWLRRILADSRLSRRELLQSTIATALISTRPSTATSNFSKRKVIVVGPGFARLACAHELLSANCDVTVFESRGRVGGRGLTISDLIPGKVVE